MLFLCFQRVSDAISLSKELGFLLFFLHPSSYKKVHKGQRKRSQNLFFYPQDGGVQKHASTLFQHFARCFHLGLFIVSCSFLNARALLLTNSIA